MSFWYSEILPINEQTNSFLVLLGKKKTDSFVRFLEESKDTKGRFEIIWPLKHLGSLKPESSKWIVLWNFLLASKLQQLQSEALEKISKSTSWVCKYFDIVVAEVKTFLLLGWLWPYCAVYLFLRHPLCR